MIDFKKGIDFIIKKPFLLLLGVPLFIYFNSLSNDFVNLDDPEQVYQNQLIQNLSFKNLKLLFTSSVLSMYQPLTSLFFAGIATFFGVKLAMPYHVFSFLVNLGSLFLVYFIGLKLFKNKTKALFLSLFFAVHPFAVESVSWVSATSTVLFTFFFLLALLYYVKYIEEKHKKLYFFSLFFFIIGCFCKVQIIPFVGVLFLVDYLYRKPLFSLKFLLQKVPFIVVAVFFGFVALSFRKQELAAEATNLNYSKLYFAFQQVNWYIIKILIPTKYGIIYNWVLTLTWAQHCYSLVSLPLGFLMVRYRKNRLFLFGVAFFVLNIILLTTLFSKLASPYFLRYTYLSSLGIWIAILSFSYKKQFIYMGAVAVVFLLILAKKQTKVWTNTEHLFAHALEVEPNLPIAFTNIGVLYINSDPKKAEKYFLKAASLEPNNAINYNNIGFIYKDLDFNKAEKYYLKALKVNPNYVNSYNNLGSLYKRTNPLIAEKYFLTALALDASRSLEFYTNLSNTFMGIDALKYHEYLFKATELKN